MDILIRYYWINFSINFKHFKIHFWILFPFLQSVESDIWSYYMLSMAFYWSLTFSQFFDIIRKDFWQMFVHHILTLLLLALSWVCNLHRVGSLVLVIHDCADIFLDAAKLTKYANYQKVCDCIFAVFTVVWLVTRLGFYPRIIYSTSIEAPSILPMFPAYYIFNSLLIALQALHIYWTYLILQIVINSLRAGQVSREPQGLSFYDTHTYSSNFFAFRWTVMFDQVLAKYPTAQKMQK